MCVWPSGLWVCVEEKCPLQVPASSARFKAVSASGSGSVSGAHSVAGFRRFLNKKRSVKLAIHGNGGVKSPADTRVGPSRAAFSRNEPTGRLVELIKTHRTHYGTFSEASPAGFYSRSPAAHHWSPHRCSVPPNLTESSSPSRVQTTATVNKWSAASRRSALV